MVARNVYQRTISNWPGRSTKNSFEKIHFSLSLSLSAPLFEFYGGRFFFFCFCWMWYPVLTTLHRKKRNPSKKKKKKGRGRITFVFRRPADFMTLPPSFAFTTAQRRAALQRPQCRRFSPLLFFFFGSLPFYLILSFLYSVAFCSCVYLSLSVCFVAHQKIIIVVIKTGRTKHTFFWENRVPSVGLENHQSRQNKRRREGHVSGHWRNTKAEPTHFGRRA